MTSGERHKWVSILPEALLLLGVIVGATWALSHMGSEAIRLHARSTLAKAPELAAAKPAQVPSKPARKIVIPDLSDFEGSVEDRVSQARELLGKFYKRSVVSAGEQVAEVGRFVYQWTERKLKDNDKRYAKLIAETVLAESEKNGFDPVFLMVVIENESSFNTRAIGPVGEIGLMQVTVGTGEWIARKYHIPWKGKASLYDPKTNIRIGAAYLAQLREEFDSHGQLYLAAYNMGSNNVKSALERSIRPKTYPRRVMKRYLRFYADIKNELKNQQAKRKPSGEPLSDNEAARPAQGAAGAGLAKSFSKLSDS